MILFTVARYAGRWLDALLLMVFTTATSVGQHGGTPRQITDVSQSILRSLLFDRVGGAGEWIDDLRPVPWMLADVSECCERDESWYLRS